MPLVFASLGFALGFCALFSKKRRLEAAREANEVSTNTKARALARRNRNRRRERVKEGKRGKRGNTNRENLTKRRLLGVEDENRNERNDEALYEIL